MNIQRLIKDDLGLKIGKKAFGEVISQRSLIELQKNEILALRMENERLKLEVDRFRKILDISKK